MATRTKRNRDFMTSAQLEQPIYQRVQLYNSTLKRRVFAEDILKQPEHRDNRAVAGVLSVDFLMEFMDVCRKVYPPSQAVYDPKKVLPPGMRSMHELLFDLKLRDKLSKALEEFAAEHADQYFETLTDLYGSRPEPEVVNRHQSSSPR